MLIKFIPKYIIFCIKPNIFPKNAPIKCFYLSVCTTIVHKYKIML